MTNSRNHLLSANTTEQLGNGAVIKGRCISLRQSCFVDSSKRQALTDPILSYVPSPTPVLHYSVR